jgi:nucleoside-diphosphate-sugar epimerase
MKELQNKVVLVTGASGFIGRHLARRLSSVAGIRLLLLSRQLPVAEDPSATWLQGSLNDLSEGYWRQHEVSRIDVVFHLGAFTPKSSSDENNVERVYSDNLMGTRALLESLPVGLERIVFFSTIDVYAPVVTDHAVLAEHSPVGPTGLYGASKLFCEKLVSVWAKRQGSKYSILRIGHIFGPGEDQYSKLIPQVLRQLVAGKSPVLFGEGKAERDLLYVADAVEAAIRAAIASEDIGPVNIVRGESLPIRDVVELLVQETGASVGIEYIRDKPDGHSLRFDNSMMKEKLGVWPLVSLSDGLAIEVAHTGNC